MLSSDSFKFLVWFKLLPDPLVTAINYPIQGIYSYPFVMYYVTHLCWSPQRDSNPRPADSYPLLLSQPPAIDVWGLDFLFTMPRLSSLGVGGWCKVSTLASPLFSPVSQCCRASTGLPFCQTSGQRGFPRFSHLH